MFDDVNGRRTTDGRRTPDDHNLLLRWGKHYDVLEYDKNGLFTKNVHQSKMITLPEARKSM